MSLRFETTKELTVPKRLSMYGAHPKLIEAYFEPVEGIESRLAFLVFASLAARVRDSAESGWMVDAQCYDYDNESFEEVGRAWIHGKRQDRPEVLETVGKWILSSDDSLWVPEQIVELTPPNPARADVEIKGMVLAR